MRPRSTTQHGRARVARRLVGAVGIAALLAAGCGDSDDSTPGSDTEPGLTTGAAFEATTQFLADVAEQSKSTSHRYEAAVSMSLSEGPVSLNLENVPIIEGQKHGDRTSLVMDLGAMMEAMGEELGEELPPEIAGIDMTIEMAADPDTLYVRAPMLAQLADATGGAVASTAELGPLAPLLEMGDQWGSVDISQMGDQFGLAAAQSALGGTQVGDPSVYLDIVAGARDVHELGESDIRGVTTRGLSAEVSFADLVEKQGVDPEQYLEQVTGSAPLGTGDAFEEFFSTTTLGMDVWVDDSGHVRRLSYEIDLAGLYELAGTANAPTEASVGFTIDWFDHGDDSISVELPDDAVDITDAFVAGL